MKNMSRIFVIVMIFSSVMQAEPFVDFARAIDKLATMPPSLFAGVSFTVTENLEKAKDFEKQKTEKGIDFLNGTEYKITYKKKQACFFVKNGSEKDLEGNLLTQGTLMVVDAANEDISPDGTVSKALFNAFRRCKTDGTVKDWQKFLKGNKVPTGSACLNTNRDVRLQPIFSSKNCKIKVIHAVGPSQYDGSPEKNTLLADAYTSALEIAKKETEEVSFPLISLGSFPQSETAHKLGMEVAVNAILTHLCKYLIKGSVFDTYREVHLLTYNDINWFNELNEITVKWFNDHGVPITIATEN